MPTIDFDELVRRSVGKSFGHVLDYFSRDPRVSTQINDIEAIVSIPQDEDVDDESGRRYFMWGVSTWAGDDVVKE